MTYAFVQQFPGLSEADYRRVAEAIGPGPWPGLVVHMAGPCDVGWQIVQVWEDAASYARFEREHLWDALAATEIHTAGAGPPVLAWLTLTDVVVGTGGSRAGVVAAGQPGRGESPDAG